MSNLETRIPNSEKEPIINEVIATNAVITDEQFQALKDAIGGKVTMSYHARTVYSDEEDIGEDRGEKLFTLFDFNYIVNPKTNQKYLVFLRFGNAENDLYFPTHAETDSFWDIHYIEIEEITDSATKALIWSFVKPGQAIHLSLDYSSGVNIGQLKESSVSYVTTRVKE